MPPTNEIDTLTMTATDAVDLAAEGRIADGYACLLWGLHRAEEIAAGGEDWGPELVTQQQASWRTVTPTARVREAAKEEYPSPRRTG